MTVNISIERCKNLDRSAHITFENMRGYYAKTAPDWRVTQVLDAIKALDNFDVFYKGELVGVMRLQFIDAACYLRDLQVISDFKNKGIGKVLLDTAKRKALASNAKVLKLRVLKISPAISLYKRNGFCIESEDERFINMFMDIKLSCLDNQDTP